jgi:8-oxo-dGTP pyrophosphatase MutT (NUDIX family)
MARTPDSQTRRSRVAMRGQSGRAPSLQVGALCWRRTSKGALRILLITSRDTGRWVIPKGWPMRNRTEAEAAAREAFEEAGVTGEIEPRSLGLYGYPKMLARGHSVPCVVRVFPLAVRDRLSSFPEAGQRKRKWFSPAKAARQVQEPELARIIRAFRPEAPETAPHEPTEDEASGLPAEEATGDDGSGADGSGADGPGDGGSGDGGSGDGGSGDGGSETHVSGS